MTQSNTVAHFKNPKTEFCKIIMNMWSFFSVCSFANFHALVFPAFCYFNFLSEAFLPRKLVSAVLYFFVSSLRSRVQTQNVTYFEGTHFHLVFNLKKRMILQSEGVAPEVNLRSIVQVRKPASEKSTLKSKTGASVALFPPNFFFKKGMPLTLKYCDAKSFKIRFLSFLYFLTTV